MTIYKYSLVRSTFTVTNSGGTAVDPGTVICKVKPPTGTVTTYGTAAGNGTAAGVTRSGAGTFYLDIDITEDGDWHRAWLGYGSNQCSHETTFTVQDSNF